MSEAQLDSALNLMRRMPPSSVENSLAGLMEMVPELTDELLTNVDQPLKVQKDTKTGKTFILCDYNRDGDSYRSAVHIISISIALAHPANGFFVKVTLV